MKLERLNETIKCGVMKHKQVEKLIRVLSETQQMLAGNVEWLQVIGELKICVLDGRRRGGVWINDDEGHVVWVWS